jgi:hypothetical protein
MRAAVHVRPYPNLAHPSDPGIAVNLPPGSDALGLLNVAQPGRPAMSLRYSVPEAACRSLRGFAFRSCRTIAAPVRRSKPRSSRRRWRTRRSRPCRCRPPPSSRLSDRIRHFRPCLEWPTTTAATSRGCSRPSTPPSTPSRAFSAGWPTGGCSCRRGQRTRTLDGSSWTSTRLWCFPTCRRFPRRWASGTRRWLHYGVRFLPRATTLALCRRFFLSVTTATSRLARSAACRAKPGWSDTNTRKTGRDVLVRAA